MLNKKILLGFVLFLGISSMTYAQTATPVAHSRQVKHQVRVHHGINNGELTRGEVVLLQKQQASIQKTKKRAKADGQVTKKEKVIIHKRQKNASENIYRKKHNGISRY